MKTSIIAVVLCVLSVASAVPLDFLGGLLKTGSQASGSAAGNVVTGSSGSPGQNSEIVQVSAQAGGSASGNAVSSNSASASHSGVSGVFGSQQQSNTNAVSNQQTFDGGLLGGLLQQPYQPNYQPNLQPNLQPNFQPNFQPNLQPNYQPGYQPGYQPNYQPNYQPQYQNQQYSNGRYF